MGERQGSSFILLHVDIPHAVFSEAFVEENVFSPLCVLGSLVKDQLAIDAWAYVWIFYSDPLVFLSAKPAILILYCSTQ
jgi:hypothetical protein